MASLQHFPVHSSGSVTSSVALMKLSKQLFQMKVMTTMIAHLSARPGIKPTAGNAQQIAQSSYFEGLSVLFDEGEFRCACSAKNRSAFFTGPTPLHAG
jgi:hypothetical protein